MKQPFSVRRTWKRCGVWGTEFTSERSKVFQTRGGSFLALKLYDKSIT